MSAMLSEPLMQRDLDAARKAFAEGSVDASIAAHSCRGENASEEHAQAGGSLKAIVFGGLDGILTAFALLAGAAGADLSPGAVLAMGLSNVLADALSMGAGEYLSSRSYNNYVRTELARETWELENYPRGEITEMIDLFEKRGMSREDAEVVIMRMAKYKEFFLNLMMTEELSLPVPTDSDDTDSLRDGFIMFASFACFGMVPIIGYACTPLVFPGLEQHNLFEIACAITAFTLFGLGVFKAFFNDKRYFMAGLETTVLGGVCAAVAFGVGRLVTEFAVAHNSQLFATVAMVEPL